MKVIKKTVVCHSMTHIHINKVQNSTYIPLAFPRTHSTHISTLQNSVFRGARPIL